MDDLNALLRQVIEHPDEDTPRLMYADALQERNDPERADAARAEFIRTQIEISHAPHCRNPVRQKIYREETGPNFVVDELYLGVCGRCVHCAALEKLRDSERGLWLVHKAKWELSTDPQYPPGKSPYCWWARGFAEDLKMSAESFEKLALAIIWHPEQTAPCGNQDAWFLSGRHVVGVNGKKYSAADVAILCPTCNGTRVVSRPCPDTAHPIRKVEFTTLPKRPMAHYTETYRGIEFKFPLSYIQFARDAVPGIGGAIEVEAADVFAPGDMVCYDVQGRAVRPQSGRAEMNPPGNGTIVGVAVRGNYTVSLVTGTPDYDYDYNENE